MSENMNDIQFEEKLRNFVEKEYIVEDYCPHCNDHSRLVKLFDCTDRYYRCLSCMKLIWKGSIPLPNNEVARWHEDNPKPQALRDFADKIEAENKKFEEERYEHRNQNVIQEPRPASPVPFVSKHESVNEEQIEKLAEAIYMASKTFCDPESKWADAGDFTKKMYRRQAIAAAKEMHGWSCPCTDSQDKLSPPEAEGEED